MPSDDRVELALQATAAQRDAFRSALGTTVEQVQSFLNEHRGSGNGKVNRIASELGPFATGRIDTERMANLFGTELALDAITLETIEKARDTISELSGRNHDLFVAHVKPGGDVRTTVATALEEIGRAFGAVRIFELTRSGSHHGNEHARSLGSFPFVKWSKGERRLAAPLVVTVDGTDLRAERLAEFLDGSQKIVLVVRGAAPPAPLVRLITPGTFVLQTNTVADLDDFGAFDGPGVAAILGDDAARFSHDPTRGAHLAQRLTVSYLPDRDPRLTIGGLSGSQQAEELRQLRALQAAPAPVQTADGTAAPGPSDVPVAPADKLAAWLLSQADVSDLG
jgi:hypothetical protein